MSSQSHAGNNLEMDSDESIGQLAQPDPRGDKVNLKPRETNEMRQHRYRSRRATASRHYRCFGNNISLADYLANRKWTATPNLDVVNVARNHPPFMYRLDFRKNLPVHDGCVNTICWNATGEYILSGSDDCHLCITKPGDMFDTSNHYHVLHNVPTHHLGNIFCARFLPYTGDKRIVSCSSEGPIIIHDINATDPSEGLYNFNCHSETIYEVVPLPNDDKVFLSCGEDKTVRLFDLRVHRSCARAGTCPHPALIRNSHAMTTLQLHPTNSNLMLVGRADGVGLVYDRRKLPDVTRFTRERANAERLAGTQGPSYRFKHPLDGVVTQFCNPDMSEKCRFTSLCYNSNGSQVLASYSNDYIYLFNHDQSSNFELVQTLPKANKEPTTSANNENNSDQTSDSQSSARGQGNSKSQSQARRRSRGARISRIRVRNDWSDTGVNSRPLSDRIEDGQANQEGDERPQSISFLEQVAVTLGTQRSLSRQRREPIEIVAGPIRWNSAHNDSNPQRLNVEQNDNNHNHNPDDDDEDDDDEDEESDRDDNSSTLIDEAEDGSSSWDVDNDEQAADYERFADETARNLVDEASAQAQQRARHTMMDIDESDERSPSRESRTSSERKQDRISSRTKDKFKKAVERLRNKFSRIPSHKPSVKYQGHRNSRTSIKESIFWGDDYIMSGSDCGRIMVWEKESAKLIMAFKADDRVVNCLAPNPSTYVLASSGIDYDIKLWSTQSLQDGPLVVDESEMKRIIENNELMLEESRYTLSVPPHLFFRMLASLVQSSR